LCHDDGDDNDVGDYDGDDDDDDKYAGTLDHQLLVFHFFFTFVISHFLYS
jgi:hypothetical protein